MIGRTIIVIPARAGSKRVPGKNLREFQGQPLLTWSIKASLDGGPSDDVIVSTDDPGAARLAEDAGVLCYERTPALAGDAAGTLQVLRQVGQRYQEEHGCGLEFIVLLQPTSPLRERGLIADALRRITSDSRATCLQTVFPVRQFTGRIVDGYWRGDYPEHTRSQDLPTHYVPSGTLYVYRYEATVARDEAWGDAVIPLIQDPGVVVNIDEESDLQRLDEVYARYRDRFSYLLE